MPSLLNFVDIEDAIKAAVLETFTPLAKKIVAKVQALVEKGDEVGALAALDAINFDVAVDKAAARVRVLMKSALMLGTSNMGPLSESVFTNGEAMPTDLLDSTQAMFETLLKTVAVENIKQRAAKAIALGILERQEEAVGKEDGLGALMKAAAFDLAAKLTAAVDTGGQVFAGIGANLTTSRLVQFGALKQAQAKGITTFQLEATLDSRTSEICKRLHGKTFKVTQAINVTFSALGTSDPDALKAIAPFVSGNKDSLHALETLSTAQLAKRGIAVPPFHPFCRTVVRKVGSVVIPAKPLFTPIKPSDLVGDGAPVPAATDLAAVASETVETRVRDAVLAGSTVEDALDEFDPDGILSSSVIDSLA